MPPSEDPAPRAGYASPSIVARRRRILEETRRLIAEQGLARLSMDEVCGRAGVAKRTLYNAFQSRERMIAAAIRQSFEDYAGLRILPDEASLDDVLGRMVLIARRNLADSNYAHALMTIYHAPQVDPEIWREIHTIGLRTTKPWIDTLHRAGQLRPFIEADELTEGIVRARFAVTNAWAQRHVPDELYLYKLIVAVLVHAAGAARGGARQAIEARLSELQAGRLVIFGTSIAPRRSPAGTSGQTV